MTDPPTSPAHPSPAAAHRDAGAARPVPCAVLTVSDTRTAATDVSGDLVATLTLAAGHVVCARDLVPDEPERIDARLAAWLLDPQIRAVLITGGTGLGRRDRTIEVVRRHLRAEIEGFGELFRSISYARIGSAAMLSRATAGLAGTDHDGAVGTFLFAMPGSPNAVETALTELVLPELGHLVWGREQA